MSEAKPAKTPRNARVHVPDATHAAAKAFCAANGRDMKRWLSKLVKAAVRDEWQP